LSQCNCDKSHAIPETLTAWFKNKKLLQQGWKRFPRQQTIRSFYFFDPLQGDGNEAKRRN
jgi:hypothetical protein